MSQDHWLQNYNATCRLVQEIAENIHERNRQQRTGGNAAKINMTLRASMQKLNQNITHLKETLLQALSQHRILQSEADRRQNLVDDLVTRERQILATFKGETPDFEPSRSSLMPAGGGASGATANPWLIDESETCGLTFGEIKQQQQHIIEVQDAGLDALAAVISRQKQMGKDIGNELDEQNVPWSNHWSKEGGVLWSPWHRLTVPLIQSLYKMEIIDDLTNLVDKTDSRIRSETRRVKLVEVKSASCGSPPLRSC
ncbi:syntaxin-8 isoform X3 [Denticeps clupeoides]|uniref:syntaxin-8 isoform X3 n=1 Tax=Denticeps clupeoides TaxID=299321 RepID=UPI0010A2EDD6|nr:syntaxin-8 isoform X3 [Denticeps clupeoides]